MCCVEYEAVTATAAPSITQLVKKEDEDGEFD
jgi:hypothetical protein